MHRELQRFWQGLQDLEETSRPVVVKVHRVRRAFGSNPRHRRGTSSLSLWTVELSEVLENGDAFVSLDFLKQQATDSVGQQKRAGVSSAPPREFILAISRAQIVPRYLCLLSVSAA